MAYEITGLQSNTTRILLEALSKFIDIKWSYAYLKTNGGTDVYPINAEPICPKLFQNSLGLKTQLQFDFSGNCLHWYFCFSGIDVSSTAFLSLYRDLGFENFSAVSDFLDYDERHAFLEQRKSVGAELRLGFPTATILNPIDIVESNFLLDALRELISYFEKTRSNCRRIDQGPGSNEERQKYKIEVHEKVLHAVEAVFRAMQNGDPEYNIDLIDLQSGSGYEFYEKDYITDERRVAPGPSKDGVCKAKVLKRLKLYGLNPISTNNLKTVANGRIQNSGAYKEWKTVVATLLPTNFLPADMAGYSLGFVMGVRKGFDLDNTLKAMIDTLEEKYGFNDNQICSLYAKKVVVLPVEGEMNFIEVLLMEGIEPDLQIAQEFQVEEQYFETIIIANKVSREAQENRKQRGKPDG